MKIALYGLPCAGKTSLMKELKNIKIIYGSEELNKLCNGHFSDLAENEKKNVRIRYTEYVNNLKDDTIISDGHYSFWIMWCLRMRIGIYMMCFCIYIAIRRLF